MLYYPKHVYAKLITTLFNLSSFSSTCIYDHSLNLKYVQLK